MKLGLKVGLGTDVAGGISPSMLTSIRMAVVNSRCLRAHKLALKGGLEVTPDMEVKTPDVMCLRLSVSFGVGAWGGSGWRTQRLYGLRALNARPCRMQVDVISYKEGMYLATLGGAKALNIDVSVHCLQRTQMTTCYRLQ